MGLGPDVKNTIGRATQTSRGRFLFRGCRADALYACVRGWRQSTPLRETGKPCIDAARLMCQLLALLSNPAKAANKTGVRP